MLKRLRIKFVCITMAIVAVMLCVIFGMVLYFTHSDLESQSIQMMQTIANNPRPMGPPGQAGQSVLLPYFTLEPMPNGELLTSGSGHYDLSDTEFLQILLDEALLSQNDVGVISRYGLRFCRVNTPMGVSVVFADMSSERATMESLIGTCLVIGVVSLAVFLLISLLLARWAVKPVERSWNQQRQFVADASHELKTPLTVIMTNAELLRSEQGTAEQRERATAGVLTMSRQMRGLVEGLLELARVDNGAVKTAFSSVEFSRVVSDAVLPFDAVFFEEALELSCQVEAGIWVKGSESHLRQVADILLDNARKYSHPRTQVRVELKRAGRGQCLLAVSNCGDEIAKEDLRNIFKRFYRGDKARAMNHSYGLGLSIAESIVRDHRGKIWAESADGVNTFFVQLPCE